MRVPVGPRQLYLIDTSAQARSQYTVIRNVIAGLIADRAAATCVTVDLEAGYSGRDLTDVQKSRGVARSSMSFCRLARPSLTGLAMSSCELAARGQHRAIGVIDLLTAAVAEHHGTVILHYDADFEHIAATTGQPHKWIVPSGTI